MKLTRLIFAAVLLAALGGLLWWSNKQEDAKAAKPAADTTVKILSLKDSDIRQVEVDHRGGENTVVKKNESNQWQIVSPKSLPTEQASAGNLATAVASVSAERVVDDNATDLATYGLSPAVLTIKIDSGNGKTSTLLVGEESPSGSIYAKVDGDPRLFTMTKNVEAQLDKSSKDLRDKRLLTFDTNLVSRIELNIAKQPPIEFGRAGAMQWQILKPKPMRADSTQVEDFSGRLHEAQMDTAISDEDAKKYTAAFASAPVAATVSVTEPGGTQTLEVRKSKDDYYGKSTVVDGVYKLTAADLTKFFDKKLEDFRAKKIFDFGFNDPTRIEIKDGAKTVSVSKAGDNWVSSGKTMDTVSVQALIDKLRDLSASKLLDSGFGTSAIDMTVVSDDGKHTEKVQIAPSGKDFLARRENDSTLYQLDDSAVQDLRTSLGDVKEQPPQPKKK
jgi:hypothetical protein